jgi:hypothetical protein
MPTPSRTTLPDNGCPAAAEAPAGPVSDAAATPDEVVDLVNHGQITAPPRR